MPIKEINMLHGKRIRVTMKKERTVSSKHFSIHEPGRVARYVEAKQKKGWKIEW